MDKGSDLASQLLQDGRIEQRPLFLRNFSRPLPTACGVV
jgi:hypothetical protein